MAHERLCAEINALAVRLEQGDVNALDLILAINQRTLLQTTEPHEDPDPQVMEALSRLAKALELALDRDIGRIFAETLRRIGYGVKEGFFGADFFKNILSKN